MSFFSNSAGMLLSLPLFMAGCRSLVLSQDDFEDGTVIITTPNIKIELTEDIVFNPNSDYEDSPNEEGAYFCLPEDADMFPGCDKTEGSFRLGFFAAISLEADNIEFDLNGYSLSAHPEFALQQRFFTLIGVGKGPFINGQGPTTFGSNINVTNIEIHNGHLGLSPHHGIHGNLIDIIEIHDLTFSDFEVAAVQLNGFNNAYLHDLDIGPSLTSVPAMGRYSQARFGLLSFREMKERLEQLSYIELEENYSIEFVDRPGVSMTAVDVINRLIDGMDLYFDFKMNGNTPQIGTEEYELYLQALKLFDNESGLPDGSALYGIILHPAGEAVNWFGAATTNVNDHAILENINIHDLQIKVDEVVAYWTEAGIQATGPYKGVLPMKSLLNLEDFSSDEFDLGIDSYLNYNGNLLSDAQIVLALYGDSDSELQRTSIDTEMIGWSKGNDFLSNGHLKCNGDDMFHMDKGVIGIRIDRTSNVEISDVSIHNIQNWSPLGSEFCNIIDGNGFIYDYDNDDYNDESYVFHTHPQTPSNSSINYKYQGRVARGIALTDVSGSIVLNNVEIDAIKSAQGSALAIDLLGDMAADIDINELLLIADVVACSELNDQQTSVLTADKSFPNHNIVSCGLFTTNAMANYQLGDDVELMISGVSGPSICGNDDALLDSTDGNSDSESQDTQSED